MLMTLRIDAKIDQWVEQIAHKNKVSRAKVVRDAIVEYAAKYRLQAQSPYEQIAHLIGKVTQGPKDLSQDTGKKFRQLLRKRK